jgi:radical SAM protein with 4Fe4S-binding SPASM domain
VFALGVGLTNACNLSCAHCYRATGRDELDADAVLEATTVIPTRAVNFGTGENALHPRFEPLVRELVRRGIAVTMTTNGHSAAALPDDLLAAFRDVELSIDFPTRDAHDAARGPGNWDLIEEQMARCKRLGVSTTIVSVLMSQNARALPELVRLAGSRAALLRVNVYQAVRSDAFALDYDTFWSAIRALLACSDLVACGEPIVRAVLGIARAPGEGCGVETIRITPRGAVVPCVYGADDALQLADLSRLGSAVVEDDTFTRLRVVPSACRSCPQRDACGGGCASRRVLRGTLDAPDAYCPFVRGERLDIPFTRADLGRALPKASSACTLIVRPRPGSEAAPR